MECGKKKVGHLGNKPCMLVHWNRIGTAGIILACGLAFVSCGRAQGNAEPPEGTIEAETVESVWESTRETDKLQPVFRDVVRVCCDNASGSGVIYEVSENRAVIVTAAHVVEMAKEAEVALYGEESTEEAWFSVAEIRSVEGLDLAFLEVVLGDMEEEKIGQGVRQGLISTEKERQESSQKATSEEEKKLLIMGYNQEGQWTENVGIVLSDWIYIEDFQCHMLLGEGEAEAGMSGGGVFDEAGSFLGVLCGKSEEGQLAVLPTAVIESEYKVFINY